MPQSLIQLPKTAEFVIRGWNVTIENHKIVNDEMGLFSTIIGVVDTSGSNKQTLYQLEKLGISFESAIECCASELELDVNILSEIIWYHIGMQKPASILENEEGKDLFLYFSKSVTGRIIADQYIEKIRSCNNWEELYEELNLKSKFRKDMTKKIRTGLKWR